VVEAVVVAASVVVTVDEDSESFDDVLEASWNDVRTEFLKKTKLRIEKERDDSLIIKMNTKNNKE
jgi:hypothetical protein